MNNENCVNLSATRHVKTWLMQYILFRKLIFYNQKHLIKNQIIIHLVSINMKIFRISLITSVLFFIISAVSLMAHPGHGTTDGHSLIHYLTEPMHATVLVAVFIMIAASITWMILKKKKATERA